MFVIRTIGVVIALSATTAFASNQPLHRTDESSLSRAQVMAEYETARKAGLIDHGDGPALRPEEISRQPSLSRAQVMAEYETARKAGLIDHGDSSAMHSDENQARSTLTREAVMAEFETARAAGLPHSGEL